MIRAISCVTCGKPLEGRQRKHCSKRCGTQHRVRVFRGAEVRFEILNLDADDATALGVIRLAKALHRVLD